MNTFLILILALGLTSGQLIKIPINSGGVTLLDVTVFLFCLVRLINIKRLAKPNTLITSALVFIGVAIPSLILTPLHLNLSEYLISFSYIVRLFLYVLFTWLFFSKELTKVFFLSGISFAILGLLQFIFFPDLIFLNSLGWDPHYFRAVSTFLDPNFAGAFLSLSLLLIIQKFSKDKRWDIFFFIIIYLALLTTFSRSSYLMFLASGITMSLLKKSRILFFITIILFFGLMLGFQIYSQAVAKPRNIDRSQSASFRLSAWQQGFTLFQKNQILGIGFNAYRYAIREYNLGDKQFLESHGSSSNDSSLVFVASTTGIIGLGAYLFFLFSLIKHKNKVVTSAMAGLIIHSLFANSLFYPPILIWLLVMSSNPTE